jgi:hypothetical protein
MPGYAKLSYFKGFLDARLRGHDDFGAESGFFGVPLGDLAIRLQARPGGYHFTSFEYFLLIQPDFPLPY